MVKICFITASAALVLAPEFGCGAGLSRTEISAWRKKLDDSDRRVAKLSGQVVDLEDRVFLLTDQLESSRTANTSHGTPSLPVVTLKPEAETANSGDSNDEVVYLGEAQTATPDKIRPHMLGRTAIVLRGQPERPVASGGAARANNTPVLPVGENLGVSPAPRLLRGSGKKAPEQEREEPAEPLRMYRLAYEELQKGNHEAAASQFQQFLQRYPRHDYADNAQYWLGECYYDRKLYAESASHFRRTVENFPTGNKAPDAMLKLGFSFLALGENRKGREVLGQVQKVYPRSEAARRAEERLGNLTQEGK